jgi:acetyl esterase/lipase
MKKNNLVYKVIVLTVLSTLLLSACGVPARVAQQVAESLLAAAPEINTADLPVVDSSTLDAPLETASPAVLLFGIGIHVEPFGAEVSELVPGEHRVKTGQDPDYDNLRDFQTGVEQLSQQLAIINAAGGVATLQLQSPFTTTAIRTGSTFLAEATAAGNELALHFHEDAHLGQDTEDLPVGIWCAVMQQEIGYILQAGGVDSVRFWSGGNLYPSVLEAGACAGMDIYGDWKNPQEQTTPAAFTSLNPWRPAGGTDGTDTASFVQNDPQGAVIYLPEGLIYRTGDSSKQALLAGGGEEAYMVYLEQALTASLQAAEPGQVNVFHITIHPGELRGDPAHPYAALEAFLTSVVQPLVAQGKLQWATYSQMADAYTEWEKTGSVPQATENPPASFNNYDNAASAADNSIQVPGGTSSLERNITYCVADGVELKMDIYTPADGSDSLPALLYVHGGAWQKGDKSAAQDQPFLQALVEAGYLVAAVNYRLAPEYQFPAMIEDVKSAVRYLRANAGELGIDADHIGAWGGSAGGHLVSLLGVTDGDEGLEGDGGYLGVSSRIQAVVDMFGPTDLTVPFDGRDAKLRAAVFGTTDESADILRIASPVTYVTPDDPPFLILQGTEDTTVPPSQSQALYDLLQAAGVESTLVMVQNAGHGLAPQAGTVEPSKDEQIRMIVAFFDQYLK